MSVFNKDERYKIVKFRQNAGPKDQPAYGICSRKRAEEICSDPKTRGGDSAKGNAWFLGFTKA